MTLAELAAATGLTKNDLIGIWDAEASGSTEPTQKLTAEQLAAAVKTLAGLFGAEDLVNNLTTTTAGKPLDAAQGAALLATINERISNAAGGTNYSTLQEAASATFSGMTNGTVKVGRFTRGNVYVYLAMRNSDNYSTMICFSYNAAKLYIILKATTNITVYSLTGTAE